MEKTSFLITVKYDPSLTTMSDIDDCLTDVIYMDGVKNVTSIPVCVKIAKAFRKILGF